MALLKKFQYPNGTETNYHKLGEIRIVPIADKVTYIEVPVEEPEVPVVPEAPVEATEPTEVVETVAEEPTEPTEVTEPEIPGEEDTGRRRPSPRRTGDGDPPPPEPGGSRPWGTEPPTDAPRPPRRPW